MKPKLRFKEFSKGWEKKKLKDIAYYKKGFAFKSKDYKPDGVKIIRVSDLGTSSIKNSNKVCIDLNEKGKYLEWELKENDLIITTVGSKPPVYESLVGKVIVVSKEFDGSLLNQNAIRVRVNKGYCQTFLPYIFDNKKYICFIETIIRGNANQGNITVNDLFDYSFKIPSLPEQTKIADFLSTVDEKIQNQQDKITHLENIKKGFMQKIFSRKIRFKDDDGNEFPEWEEKKLEEIAYLKKGVQLDKDEIVEGGKYYHLNGGINPSNYTNKYNVRENTISISEGGNSCGYINWNKEKFFSGGHNYTLQNMSSFIDKYYLYQYLKHNEDKIMRLRVGSGLPNIQQKDLNKFIIKVPLLIEQEKIADFLSSFDKKIDVEKDTLNHLKELKKGLLQQVLV